MDDETKALFRNMEDHSDSRSDTPGFQFKLPCPGCREVYATKFVPYSKGASRAGLFSKGPDQPIEQTAEWAEEKRSAIQQAAKLFADNLTFCEKCGKHVCEKCWNTVRQMCLPCCANEAARAMAEGLREEEERRQAALNAVCGKCGTKVAGFKFCPGCGAAVAPKGSCPNCQARLPAGAQFCPECGKKV